MRLSAVLRDHRQSHIPPPGAARSRRRRPQHISRHKMQRFSVLTLFLCATVLPVNSFHAASFIPLQLKRISPFCSVRPIRAPRTLTIQALESNVESNSKKAEALKLAESARRALLEAEAAERKVVSSSVSFIRFSTSKSTFSQKSFLPLSDSQQSFEALQRSEKLKSGEWLVVNSSKNNLMPTNC